LNGLDVADRTFRLEYSKINSMNRDNKDQSHTETLSSGSGPKAFLGNLSTFDLSSLVEEVVESLVAGHQHSSRAQTPAHSPMTENGPVSRLMQEGQQPSQSPIVILGVDHRATWFIVSDSASWRRCIMNLLGNALKYTDHGYVEVMLRTNTESSNVVTLMLRDTGRGIGKAYLENHLFRPFVQEDALSSTGIGLGLSIVKNLVDAMGGWVEVQSEVGIGTQVEISIPVNFVPTPSEVDRVLPAQQTGLKFCFAGLEAFTDEKRSRSMKLSISQRRTLALKRAVSAHLGDWLKVKISSSTSADGSMADIIVVEEEDLSLFNSATTDQPASCQLPAKSILLVLCTQHNMQHHSMYPTSDRVYYLSQPFGPRRLASLVARVHRPRNKKDIMPSVVTKPQRGQSRDVSSSDVWMPLLSNSQKTDSSRSIMEVSAASPASTGPTRGIPRVLLVDDNDINLTLLTRCMQRLKIQYGTALNGAEALETYKSADPPFDCVFMDISMPVMDGFAATRAIRDFERRSGRAATQIIAMTGLGSAKARQEGLSSGMDVYLTKPVQLKKIQSLIQGMSIPSAAGT
jgi:CheY-like chemotaxis protein